MTAQRSYAIALFALVLAGCDDRPLPEFRLPSIELMMSHRAKAFTDQQLRELEVRAGQMYAEGVAEAAAKNREAAEEYGALLARCADRVYKLRNYAECATTSLPRRPFEPRYPSQEAAFQQLVLGLCLSAITWRDLRKHDCIAEHLIG